MTVTYFDLPYKLFILSQNFRNLEVSNKISKSKVKTIDKEWDIGYIVITSVDRDDLADGGSAHFAETVKQVKIENPGLLVECLVPDWTGDMGAVELVANSGLKKFFYFKIYFQKRS